MILYTPESFKSYHLVNEEWVCFTHNNYDEMAPLKEGVKTFWQKEGLHILKLLAKNAEAINFASIVTRDKAHPGGWMGQVTRLFPEKRFFFAWVGNNPLIGINFSVSLHEELQYEGVNISSIEPKWYCVTPDGEVFDYLFVETSSTHKEIERLCQSVQKNEEIFKNSPIEHLGSDKFGIGIDPLPRGKEFLSAKEVISWAEKTTKKDKLSWQHVYACIALREMAKACIDAIK